MPSLYSEKKVREKIAVSAADFRRIRVDELKLEELTGWVKLKGGAIALTGAGLGRVLGYVQATMAAGAQLDFVDCLVNAAAPSNGNGAAEPLSEEMAVLKVYRNRHLLRCRRLSDGAQIDVWVSDNKKFVPKMTLRATTNAQGQHRLAGRCPRRRGRY